MKLFLDDLRPAPDGWTHARTASEAITHLQRGGVTALSLDHDLGEAEAEVRTGYQVACWIEQCAHEGRWNVVPKTITIHSANPVGRANIQAAIDAIERLRAELTP